jgi:o-succinylbenzoate synthase
MRIAAAVPLGYALPLARSGPGKASPQAERRGWLLRIDTDDGRSGFGECAPLPSHGSESHAAAEAALQQWCARLPAMSVADALAAVDAPAGNATPAATAAVDCALLDLAAQAAGQPLHRLLAPASKRRVAVNALAGDLLTTTPTRIGELLDAGFTVLKLKLGHDNIEAQLAALRRLADTLPPRISLRLDANRAWTPDEAARIGAALAGLPVESLEEPLRTPQAATLAALQCELPFAIALDESGSQLDQESFFAAPPVRRLVIKLAPHGGLRRALATARRARDAGIECVITTGIDSACATLAAAHLAAAIDNGLAHGLATSEWLAADTGAPPTIRKGLLELPDTPGLGFRPTATR